MGTRAEWALALSEEGMGGHGENSTHLWPLHTQGEGNLAQTQILSCALIERGTQPLDPWPLWRLCQRLFTSTPSQSPFTTH